MRIYFDNAATTPIGEKVLEAMMPYFIRFHGNPSSIHAEGRAARAAIENARKQVAHCIGASIGEIFFTSGGTESNNMALKCAVRDLGVARIISSPLEHHCVLHSMAALRLQDIDIQYVKFDKKGQIDLQHLEQLLAKTTDVKTLVTLMHANNEVGTILNLQKTAEICQKFGAFLHSDTVQTIGQYPINVTGLNIDFLSGSAHKFHGPKGVGFIYINSKNRVQPFMDGGSQERNMRGGTENIYGIVGLATALLSACDQMENRRQHVESLRNYCILNLKNQFSDILFNGDFDGDSLYKLLSVSFPNTPKTELLLLHLDIEGISASGGSACSSGVDAGSHVLAALDPTDLRRTIRFSFSHKNTLKEIDFLIEKLKMITGLA